MAIYQIVNIHTQMMLKLVADGLDESIYMDKKCWGGRRTHRKCVERSIGSEYLYIIIFIILFHNFFIKKVIKTHNYTSTC